MLSFSLEFSFVILQNVISKRHRLRPSYRYKTKLGSLSSSPAAALLGAAAGEGAWLSPGVCGGARPLLLPSRVVGHKR